jgi:carboxyl-terminal processing protease
MNHRYRITRLLTIFGLAVFVTAASLGGDSRAPLDAATEANITLVTASILGSSQFAHHSLDNVLADAFLDRYLQALDGDRSLFLQSDMDEFAAYRATLARDTLGSGDDRAAYAIFDRYLQRLGQRIDYITDRLQTATFDFSGDASYSMDRKSAPRPRDLTAARELWWQQLRFDYLQEKLNGKPPEQIATTLGNRARGVLRDMQQTSRDQVLAIYLTALAHVYDPHSDYLGHEEMGEFAISMNLSLFGIGAKLQSVDGYCKIVELIPGGPAARSGKLGPGDRIVAVTQNGMESVDVVDMPLGRVVELIRGPKGSVVTLSVISASAVDDTVRESIRLVRDEIKLEDQRATSRIIDLPTGKGEMLRIGVINLPSFYADMVDRASGDEGDTKASASASADVARLLDKLKAENVQGIVLDLRLNGGGALDEAINLTGLFITTGPVVQTRGPDGDIDVGADTDPAVQYDGPLVVLTSRFSASASEIVAGALQDYGRALIVGDPSTFGKGTVQSILRLAPLMDQNGLRYSFDPGAIKVTTRKFYRPSGSSTQLKGVVPDIVLPSLSGVSEVGESALDDPLPWDTVPTTRYDRLGMVRPYRDILREESARRVKATEAFAYLRAEIALLEEKIASKTVSLNESLRRQELARTKERKKAYEASVKALPAPAPTTYEITLENAALPGLPPPLTSTDAAASAQSGEDDPELVFDNRSAKHDIILNETGKILADYVRLSAQQANRGTMQGQSPVQK